MNYLKNLWFRDKEEDLIFINDNAVRMRAGFLLLLPTYMLIVLFTSILAPPWTVLPSTFVTETFDMTEDFRVVYDVQAFRTVFDYSTATIVLLYGLFELLIGLSIKTSYLSPTIHLTTFLTRNKKPSWKPYKPKKFAWIIGVSLISSCLIFLNPDSFATFLNEISGMELLPTDQNYMPFFIPILVWACFGLMWLEAVLGLCLGCKLHWVLSKIGIFKEECYACNNLDF